MNNNSPDDAKNKSHQRPNRPTRDRYILLGLLCAWTGVFLIGSFIGSNTYSSKVLSHNLGAAAFSLPLAQESSLTCECDEPGACACKKVIIRRFDLQIAPGSFPPDDRSLLCDLDSNPSASSDVTADRSGGAPSATDAAPDRVESETAKRRRSEEAKDPLGQLLEPIGARHAPLSLKLVLSWTWTNILFLCCFSSMIGDLASRRSSSFVSALSRAFFIYLFLISGQLVFAGEISFNVEEPSAYFRIASVASTVGFLVGFNPNFFMSSIRRFAGKVGDES